MSSPKINTRKSILVRAYVAVALILAFALFLLVGIAKLQFGKSGEFAQARKIQSTRVKEIPALRGNIYAADGSLLATSVPRYDINMDPNADGLTKKLFDAKIDSFSALLAIQFNSKYKNAEEWRSFLIQQRKKKSRYISLAKDVGFEQVKKVKTWPIAREGKFVGGVWFEEKGKRMYFMGDLARRTIGRSENGTHVGLEGAFDTLLRGKNGKQLQQRMPGGIWRPLPTGNQSTPVNGADIVTTLDVRIQDIAQYSLLKGLQEVQAHHGCVVVMETKTGAIKAMANLKRGTDGQYYESQNYAVDEFTEPGSTFKVLAAISLLEDKKVTLTDSISNEWGKWKYYDLDLVDAVTPKKKFYTLAECLQNSSNVGTAKFVLQHYKSDPEDFTDHAIQLGLHMKPNFDIPSSNFPTIKTPESSDWSAISLPSMSIGYYARISPLQLLMLYNTIANKGVMMQPYMVSEIHAQGKKAQKIEPKVLNKQAISVQTTQVLTDMLTTVIDKGTASNIKSENYKIAGKTGTAWLSSGNKGYGDKKEFQAAFAGFFPANDPQFTIIVVVNSPNGVKYSGSQISAPIFKAISDRIYATHIKTQPVIAQYSVPEAPGVLKGDFYQTRMIFNELGISSQLLQADSITETPKFIEPSREAHSVKLKPVAYNSSLVPDVRGMGLRDAMKVLKSMGYQVTFNGYGRVTDQSPSSGSARKNSGNSIHLILKPF